MRNILNKEDLIYVINRVNSLTPNTIPLWGRMNASQMTCHCSDQILMALGKIEFQFAGNLFSNKVLKNLILLGMPAPKGKVKTNKEIDQFVSGTKPTSFEKDVRNLIERLERFDNEFSSKKHVAHPTFGKMSKREWGRLIFVHLDHHLKQFGN